MNPDTNNKESENSRRSKHDADSGNDSSSNDMLQKENLIDPGNEHHHSTEADNKASDKKFEHSSKDDADSGSDASGTVGPAPKKGE